VVPTKETAPTPKEPVEQPRSQEPEAGQENLKPPAPEKSEGLEGQGDSPPKHPWESRPEPSSDQVLPRAPEVTLQDRLDDMSRKISARTADKPMTKEQFAGLFEGMSEPDRKLALQVMEQSNALALGQHKSERTISHQGRHHGLHLERQR
jgi:hypothetical protein